MKFTCRVPQGSNIGPLLFNIYMLLLDEIVEYYNISYRSYADDTHLCICVRKLPQLLMFAE